MMKRKKTSSKRKRENEWTQINSEIFKKKRNQLTPCDLDDINQNNDQPQFPINSMISLAISINKIHRRQ